MEQPPAAPTFVGIDVAKDRLDVHLRPSDEAFALSRDDRGLQALVERLAALPAALVVLEATGGFEVAVAGALAAAGLPLVVVNPRQIRDFARASPRPTAWMPRRSRALPRPSDRRRDCCRTPPPKPSASWSPAGASWSR
jgi:transposase